jgi:hypothetical protein
VNVVEDAHFDNIKATLYSNYGIKIDDLLAVEVLLFKSLIYYRDVYKMIELY